LKTTPFTLLAGASGLVMLVAAPPTIAQQSDQPAASSPQLEEIVVTSRRVEEKLQNVPIAVTAFTAKDLEEKQIAAIDAIGEGVPDVYVHYTLFGSASTPSITIQSTIVNDPFGERQVWDGIHVQEL
jgi:iron complex outermembrane recepter protein